MKALSLLIVLFLVSSLVANEKNSSLDSYISKNKKKQFDYDYQKSEADGLKLRDSWIAPLNLRYSYSRSNPYDDEQVNYNASIKMDQTIFQSGGIYYAIKFADASKRHIDYSVDLAKRKMIKDAISLLMQIKQMDLKEKKQGFRIENSEINLAQKREQYINGQLDSGFLDNAVIDRNNVIQALYDIQTAKQRLISSFETISDLDYKQAKVPHLTLLNEDEFLKHNISLKMASSQSKRDKHNKDVTVAKYLPKFSITAGYNWQKSQNQNFKVGSSIVDNSNELEYYDYGFKVSMPININTFRDIESARVSYLKSKLQKEDKKVQLNAVFEQVMQNIENFQKKKNLSLENQNLYEKLLQETVELYNAGYKTNYDVEILQNSVAISKLDSKIFKIDKQLELLTLYEMYNNEI